MVVGLTYMTDFTIMSLFHEHFNPLSVLEFKHYTEQKLSD